MAEDDDVRFVRNRALAREEKDFLAAKTESIHAEMEDGIAAARHARRLEKLELRFEEANSVIAELQAAEQAIQYEKAKEAERERKAANKFHHVHAFESDVNDVSVRAAIAQLDLWRRTDPGSEVTLRFYSPGGDVIAGMYLFDYLERLKREGHHLLTEAYGYAASMAGILLQVGHERLMGRESYILIHEIAFSVRGKVGEVEDEMEFVKKISDRVLNIFATRAKEAGVARTATHPLTKTQFASRWKRKDWWLSSDEALKYGVVDRII